MWRESTIALDSFGGRRSVARVYDRAGFIWREDKCGASLRSRWNRLAGGQVCRESTIALIYQQFLLRLLLAGLYRKIFHHLQKR